MLGSCGTARLGLGDCSLAAVDRIDNLIIFAVVAVVVATVVVVVVAVVVAVVATVIFVRGIGPAAVRREIKAKLKKRQR